MPSKRKFIANLGDINPLEHGGFFVYDNDGAIEVSIIEWADEGEFRVYDFSCDGGTIENEWWFDDLNIIADYCGTTKNDIVLDMVSGDPVKVAQAFQTIIAFWGPRAFDDSPSILTRREVHNRFRKECYS